MTSTVQDNASIALQPHEPRIGTKIRQARKERRWSQAEFGKRVARAIGRHLPFSQAAVSDFERGAVEVPAEIVQKLPEVFGGSYSHAYFGGGGVDENRLDDRSGIQLFFDKWTPFPELLPLQAEDLDPSRKLYLSPAHAKKVNEILIRSGGLDPVFVRLSRGHGCTTLSRFIFRRLVESALIRRMIPVRLALAEIPARQLLEQPLDAIQEAMRRDIVWSLAHEPWDYVLGREQYAEIIGAPSPDPDSWEPRRSRLRGLVQESDKKLAEARDAADPSSFPLLATHPKRERVAGESRGRSRRTNASFFNLDALKRVAPVLARPINNVLASLATDFKVSVSLQVDLSSPLAYMDTDSYDQLIAALQSGLKTREADETLGVAASALRLSEVYFGHVRSFDGLEYGWRRPVVEVEFPWYSPLDFFGMLAYHYVPSNQPVEPGGESRDSNIWPSLSEEEPDRDRLQTLGASLSPELLTGIVAPDIPIPESVRLLTNRLRRSIARRRSYEATA